MLKNMETVEEKEGYLRGFGHMMHEHYHGGGITEELINFVDCGNTPFDVGARAAIDTIGGTYKENKENTNWGGNCPSCDVTLKLNKKSNGFHCPVCNYNYHL